VCRPRQPPRQGQSDPAPSDPSALALPGSPLAPLAVYFPGNPGPLLSSAARLAAVFWILSRRPHRPQNERLAQELHTTWARAEIEAALPTAMRTTPEPPPCVSRARQRGQARRPELQPVMTTLASRARQKAQSPRLKSGGR